MCGNRVEELEARVKELEASIEGLTDELVECKVRLRELEGAVDEDLGFAPVTEEEAEKQAGPNTSESPEEAQADTSNTEASEEEDNAESGTSDIIVA